MLSPSKLRIKSYQPTGACPLAPTPLTHNYARYDDADRLIGVNDANLATETGCTGSDALKHSACYGYDTESNLTGITDANNNATTFSYDTFRRVTQTKFPSGLVENYAYDAVGNLSSKTDRKNQQITYTYDQLNRLTGKTYPDNSTVNYTYDLDSRLTQVTDPTGTYQFTFDNMGRLTNTTTSYAFLTGRHFTTAYGYDAASNRTGFTDPESGSTSYVYDTLNRLQTLTPPAAISSGSFGFGYDALSRRTSLTRPNAVNTAYAYDNLSHLLSVTHAKSGTTLDGASYTVDNAGNRTSRTPLPGTTATNYTYDNLYELLTAKQGATTTESYTYDPVGNRLTQNGSTAWSYNPSNELTSRPGVTYTYDNNGNTLTKVDSTGTKQYAWDFENRLASVTLPGTGGTVSFKYDPFGRRIYKSSSAGTSIYAYDGDNLIEETNSSGGVIARYSQGLNIDEPLAMLRNSTTSYYEADGLNSVTSLSNAAGSLAQTYAFDSFGKQTNSSGSLTNAVQYTAREFDSETGLYYYRARYYDPNGGRFRTEDPVRFSAGANFYRYVGNNSTLLNDPFGLWKNTGLSAQKGDNTIVCNGSGSIEVQLSDSLAYVQDVKACLGPCIKKHEEQHMKDALAQNPNICKGTKQGIQVGFSNNKEGAAAEIAGYTLEIKCLRDQEKQATCDKCTPMIDRYIKGIQNDQFPYWRKILSPSTPKINF